MLEAVLTELRNWFDRNPATGERLRCERGEFSASAAGLSGMSVEPADGQLVRVSGSVFNDGLHEWPCTGLADETFYGEVQLLAVPKAVVELAEDVAAWEEANGEAARSPYQSESFDGYSYSKAQGADGSASVSWQQAFAPRLKQWRRL